MMASTTRKEILYEGYYYDVTDFIKRHPGGEEILEYHTLRGEDATIPIQQFHNRSLKKVLGILKSFKRRPAVQEGEEGSLKPVDPVAAKNKVLTEDFLKLFRELQNEGLFDPSPSHVAYRLLEMFAFTAVGVLVLNRWTTGWGLGLGCSLLAMALGRAGWIQHEAGHHSLTGVPKVDRAINSALFGLWQGVAGNWWRLDHNQHHAMTNRLHHDVDLDLSPLIAVNMAVMKDNPEKLNFILRNQKYFLPLDALLALHYMKWWHTPVTLLKTGNMLDLSFIMIHYYFVYHYVPFKIYLLSTWLAVLYLYGQFGMSHTFLPVRDEPTHWVEAALAHTTDVEQRPWCDWWMGYLNYQIEHHLFPTMPQYKNLQAVERVKALAEKHGLPYYVFSYKDAFLNTMKNLFEVEDELKKM